ncbi:MAG: aminotransferase class III-fold pyridoxal phosphate-dependent enzyme [Proteobacteria bacterium]|nr:aminotransferase class III-fold pyridoxal phosphate-dependent enzyme [Pseudomonadota bacterium]
MAEAAMVPAGTFLPHEADAVLLEEVQALDALVTRAYHNGLILLSCGQSTVRFMPPLMISEADVDEAVALVELSLKEALAGPRR